MAQREMVNGAYRRRPQHVAVLRGCILILALAIILAAVPRPYVRAPTDLPHFIDEYDVPTPNAAPLALAVDRSGNVWLTESNATKLAMFDPRTGAFKEYSVPGSGDMWGMTIDFRGNIWVTQYSLKGSVNPGGAIEPGGSGRLIRFDPGTGNFTVIEVPTPGAFPFRVTSDAEGRIWFTELLGNQVGFYDPSSGKLHAYEVPTQFAGPADLTFDSYGTLWFTEAYNGSVAKFMPQSNTFVEYHFASLDPYQYVGSPVGISAQNGIVWVADHGGNWIVEFNSTSQHVTLYPTHFPPPDVYPISLVNDLVVDRRGRVWFTEHGGNSIGYLDPGTQRMVEFPIPTGPISTALWLALAPNGDLWFTEWSSDKIGIVHANLPVPFTLSVSEPTLRLPVDGQAHMSLELSSSLGPAGSGAYVYSWPSYNRGDANVTFSPAESSVSGETNVQTQATIAVSPRTLPGEYMLGLGFDVGSVRVWRMVRTDVTAQPSLSAYVINNPWFPVGAVALILFAALMILRRRIRGLGHDRRAYGAGEPDLGIG